MNQIEETIMGERYLWADCLKGILMVLVIIGHVIWFVYSDDHDSNHIYNLIYSFHMPCFMAISGWLAFRSGKEYGGGISLYIRRFKQLMIPYLCWSFIQALLLKGNLFKIVYDPNGYFWFLWTLFWIYVIFVKIRSVASRLNLNEECFSIVSCLALMLIMVILDFRLFGFQFISYYFLFYYFGFVFHKYNFQLFFSKFLIVIMVALWAILGWFWSMHSLPEWMPKFPFIPISVTQYAYRGFTAIIAIVILLNISPIYLNSNSKLNNYLGKLGKISLGLYIVHLLLVKLLVKYVPYIADYVRGNLLIEILFSICLILVSTVIVRLLHKNKYLAYSLGKF